MDEYVEEKQLIVDVCLKLYRERLIVGTWGNVSMRVKKNGEDMFLVTPSGMDYEKTKPEDIVVMNGKGEVLDGTRKPTSELKMHLKVYEDREDVNAIIHTHSVYASACAVTGNGIPMIVEDMIQHLKGNVRVAKYALPGTEELAENLVEAIRERNGALLKNHGAVGVGKDMDAAFKSCVLIEKSAQILAFSKMMGHVNLVSTEDANKMIDYYNNQYGQR